MGLLCSRSRSQWRSRQYFLNHSTFSYQIWYGDVASWARVMQTFCCCCYLQGQGRSKGLCDQNMTLYNIIWAVDSLATKLGLMIHHQKPECPVKKWITVFRIKVTARGQNLMFVQMVSSTLLNVLFSNLVLWFIIMSQSIMQKDWFAIFKVKVTARAHMIKIRQFLLYLLNCWSFCYRTWFDSTLS